jgi:hypothetical protein
MAHRCPQFECESKNQCPCLMAYASQIRKNKEIGKIEIAARLIRGNTRSLK